MFLRFLIFTSLFIIIKAQITNEINKVRQSGISMSTIQFWSIFWISFVDINVAEHEPSNVVANDADDHSRQTTTERTLIR